MVNATLTDKQLVFPVNPGFGSLPYLAETKETTGSGTWAE
jgi:hypothetical protein